MTDHGSPRGTGRERKVGALAVALASLALGSAVATAATPATRSADGWKFAAPKSCQPKEGAAVRTLLLVPARHIPPVRANVGDTIKVIVDNKGDRMGVPKPLNHKQAVCRISWHRVSASKVIAKFRARRAPKQHITFGSSGMTSDKGCPPDSHGCPHGVLLTGDVRIKSSARSFTG
jgi:hypothetical protein